MTDMYQFVDEIFKDYGRYSDNFEEDQMLPSRESLLDVCRVLLNASCLPEEGRYPPFVFALSRLILSIWIPISIHTYIFFPNQWNSPLGNCINCPRR